MSILSAVVRLTAVIFDADPRDLTKYEDDEAVE